MRCRITPILAADTPGAVPAADGRSWRRLLYESLRQTSGITRRGRKLLLVAEDGANRAQDVPNGDDANADDYIERFYNQKRQHSTIGDLSHGVQKADEISFGCCQPNRVQARPMLSIVSVNPDQSEWVVDDVGHDPRRLELILTDKHGDLHPIAFEESALRELAMLLRSIQEGWPGALGGH